VDAVTRATVDVHIGLHGRRDLCGQVCRQLRAAILDRRLLPGQALPSSRELAQRLAPARNAISVAYDRLVAEGLLVSRAGVGTFVSAGPGRLRGFQGAATLLDDATAGRPHGLEGWWSSGCLALWKSLTVVSRCRSRRPSIGCCWHTSLFVPASW
jgi:DNA-binding transcriptional regulator YhcF (GntR family)